MGKYTILETTVTALIEEDVEKVEDYDLDALMKDHIACMGDISLHNTTITDSGDDRQDFEDEKKEKQSPSRLSTET